MEKRLFLAVGLSFLVVFAFSKIFPVEKGNLNNVNQTQTEAVEVKSETVALNKIDREPLKVENTWELNNDIRVIKFLEPQAVMGAVKFSKYQDYDYELSNAIYLENQVGNYAKIKTTDESVSYAFEDKNKVVTKTFSFSKSNYSMDLEVKIRNKSNATLKEDLSIILGTLEFANGRAANSNQVNTIKDYVVSTRDEVVYPDPKKDFTLGNIKFLGLRDRYFCAIVQPNENNYIGFVRSLNKDKSEIGLVEKGIEIDSGKEIVRNFSLYLGPQDVRLIKQVNKNWTSVIYYGKLDIIAQILMFLLDVFYKMTSNWGAAIVIFSLAMYIILWPLSYLQMKSIKEMQIIQPKLEELKIKYKDDSQRFTKEQMLLFQEHKINPFGGCFFLLLQIPVFVTLYQVLTRTVMLKGAKFLWIKDLTAPDRMFILPFNIPMLGNEVNFLPILMCVGMMIQQKVTTVPQASGPNQDQQKLMMFLMPIILLFAFYKMPSGVNLYWVMNNILMLIYQLKVVKFK